MMMTTTIIEHYKAGHCQTRVPIELESVRVSKDWSDKDMIVYKLMIVTMLCLTISTKSTH